MLTLLRTPDYDACAVSGYLIRILTKCFVLRILSAKLMRDTETICISLHGAFASLCLLTKLL